MAFPKALGDELVTAVYDARVIARFHPTVISDTIQSTKESSRNESLVLDAVLVCRCLRSGQGSVVRVGQSERTTSVDCGEARHFHRPRSGSDPGSDSVSDTARFNLAYGVVVAAVDGPLNGTVDHRHAF